MQALNMAFSGIIRSVVFLYVMSICGSLPANRNRDAALQGDGHHGNRISKVIRDMLDDTDLDIKGRLLGENLSDEDGDDSRELWEKIQHHVVHHLKRIEGNLMDQIEYKTSRLNQTVTINYLYKVYQYLIEEVEIGKRIGEMRAGEIEKVRKIALDQGKKLVGLENSLRTLKDLANNLTDYVEKLRLHGVSKPDVVDVTTSPPNPTTTYRIKPQFPVDCHEVYQLGGMKYEGDYFIKINPYLSGTPFETCCKMQDNAGWTVIQRRQDGSVDFYRDWHEYKQGFGTSRGEYWLGNDRINQLTNQDDYMLRIEMLDFDGRHYYAEYDHFRILDESHDYRMHVHGFHGNAGDSLTPTWNNHDGQPFSTRDNDHDDRYYDNCAERFHGAWWFKSCFESHLNGLYYKEGKHDNYFNQNGIQWNTVGHHYSLKSVVMMVKPNKQFASSKEHNDEISNDIQ